MTKFTQSKNITAVRKQIIEDLGANWNVIVRESGYFVLRKIMGDFVLDVSSSSIAGYGEGRVLQPSIRMRINQFHELAECIPWCTSQGDYFDSPFVMKHGVRAYFVMPTHIPYSCEEDLEKHKPQLLEHIRTGISHFPMISKFDELDQILGPITSDSLNELMENWIEHKWESRRHIVGYHTEIPAYPNVTLNVWYGAYAFGIWKVILSKVLGRDYEVTKKWFQGLLDQGIPNFNNLNRPEEDKKWFANGNHEFIFPKIASAFQKLTHE